MFDSNFLEDEIYAACDENPRDFTQEEISYIQDNGDLQKILLEWFQNEISVDCWTANNRQFMLSITQTEHV